MLIYFNQTTELIQLNLDFFFFQTCGKCEHLMIQFLQLCLAASSPEAVIAKVGQKKKTIYQNALIA